jgi:oligopeptide/dipeptide ABC transporter ATP-binding protein
VEAIRTREPVKGSEARARARDLLARVELPDPDRVLRAYPHELSGGMRQRALIAMAVACGPSLLIADEPTTALDVTVQAQILDLLASIRDETGMALLLISHDLAVVSNVADRVAVMYAGQIVEMGPVGTVFRGAGHPYTEGLLSCVPSIDRVSRGLAVIPGRVPESSAWPPGCRFHPRCPYAWERCAAAAPPPERVADDEHEARCWLLDEPGHRAGRGYDHIRLEADA